MQCIVITYIGSINTMYYSLNNSIMYTRSCQWNYRTFSAFQIFSQRCSHEIFCHFVFFFIRALVSHVLVLQYVLIFIPGKKIRKYLCHTKTFIIIFILRCKIII